MYSEGDIRRRWLAQMFSTEPAQRVQAESAIKALYRSADCEEPIHFCWFESPFEASWVVALLRGPEDFIWQQILAATGKSKSSREKIEQVRSELREALAQPTWDAVLTAIGPRMDTGRGPGLQLAIGNARTELYGVGPFPSFDLGDDLHRAELSSLGVLSQQLHWRPTNLLLATSFASTYSFSLMAADEAKAGGGAPAALAAAWTIARSAGLWWPFTHAAIVIDRPAEVHTDERRLLHRGDGPAAVYRDGSRAYAWRGQAMPEEWILHPESIPAGKLRECDLEYRMYVEARTGKPVSRRAKRGGPSAILKADLPQDPAERLDRLRQHNNGRLPFFDRYAVGEHAKVWAELVALGPAVREDPHAADALAVAYQTMERVAANVQVLIKRLRQLNYNFKTQASEVEEWIGKAERATSINLDRLRTVSAAPYVQDLLEKTKSLRGMLQERVAQVKQQPRDHSLRAHVPPDPDVRKDLRRLERLTGPLPLSLRVFYEVVGSVDLMGDHPSLAPRHGDTCPDPLVVFPLESVLAECEEMDDEDIRIWIAPDDLQKADTSGGEPYEIAVPDPRADAELLNERHELFFVDYLRLCFQFGGFPGYEGIDRDLPPEIASLREGLLPI